MKAVEELQTEINKILFKEIDNLELKRLLNKNFIEKTLNSSTVSLLFNEEKKTLTFIFSISQILRMEFAEVIDWSKMPVDTKVLVSKDGEIWFRRYFAKYEDGKVYFFSCGASSYSIDDISNVLSWEYVKLYQK